MNGEDMNGEDMNSRDDDTASQRAQQKGGPSRELEKSRQSAIVQAIDEHGLGDVIKPLTREIYLLDTYIAGTANLEDPKVLSALATGQELQLQREENRYDEHAIAVLDAEGHRLGYVPERHELVFSRLMEACKLLTAKVTDVEPSSWYTKVGIRIFMVDF